MEKAGTTSTWSTWASGLFVSFVFALLFVEAFFRLQSHAHGETFMQADGALDSLIVILTPAAVVARLYQMVKELKARKV